MEIKDNTNKKIYTLVCSLVLIGAFCVVLMISLLSEFGRHPDEYDVRACMDWAMSHWIWPDMRLQGTGLGDTYSWYGYTKMSNYTVYFLVASKVAFIFKLFMGAWPYYRVPNLLLALFLLVFCLKKVQDKKYIMVCFGLCAQAWYIFSYVTADALDFVLAFISIYLIADKESMLWKCLTIEDDEKKAKQINIGQCICLGVVFGLMLLGKPYYYSILVLIFVVLLLYLIQASKNKRALLWKKYFIILGISVSIFAARAGFDFYYYGTDKAAIELEMMEIYAADDKKPSTPIEEQLQTYHCYEKGHPISYIFEDDPHWFLKSYRSFASACISTDGNNVYFGIMAIMYIAIIVFTAMSLCSLKFGDDRAKTILNQDRIIFVVGILLMAGGVAASVINSYLIDSQPQGRYLLPLPLICGYLTSKSERLWKNKAFLGIVIAACVLSLAYFGLFDSRELIDLGYVRSLFA